MTRLFCGAALLVSLLGCDTRTSPAAPDDSGGSSDPDDRVNVVSPPNDATLRILQVSPGVLAPAFSATASSYSVLVPAGTSTVSVSATPTNAEATLAIQGEPRVPGTSVDIVVAPPSTSIVFNVTSPDRSATRAYRVTVRIERDEAGNGNDNGGTVSLDVPADFRVTAVTTTEVSLAWNLLAEASNYTLYRDTSPTGTFSTVAGSTTNTVFTDLNREPATTYFYRLQATSSSAVGTLSPPLEATTLEVARIEYGDARCMGGPIYTDSDTAVTLEVDVDVRLPGGARASVDEVTIDLRDFGRTAFDRMTQQGASATWATGLTIPSGTAEGTYTFAVRSNGVGLTAALESGPSCEVVVRPVEDTITIAATTLTPNAYVAGGAQTLVLTAELATTGAPTLDALSVDFSAVGGAASVAMVDDGTGADTTAGDGIYAASFAAPNTLAAGTYSIGVRVSGTGAAGAINDTASETLTVSDAPALTLANAQVTPSTVFNKAADPRDVTLSIEVTPVGGAAVDSVTADLTAVGGTASTFSGGPTYTLDFTVPAGQTPNAYPITIVVDGNDGSGGSLTENSAVTLTVEEHVSPAPGFTYVTLADGTNTPETLSAGAVTIPSPFAIQFYGTTVAAGTGLTFRTNGTVGIGTVGVESGTAPTDAAGYLAAATATSPLVAAFHHEPLVVNGSATPAQGIYAELSGTAPEQIWTIEWFLEAGATGSVQIQLVFYEDPTSAGADFEVRYGTMNVQSPSPQDFAVVGVRDANLNDDIITGGATDPSTLTGTGYIVDY